MNLCLWFSAMGLAMGMLAGCATPNPEAKPPADADAHQKPFAKPVSSDSREGSDSLESSGANEVPKRTFTVFQEYPVELIEKKIEGEVLVEFIVTRDGNVANAFAVSAPHPLMADAAVRAISAWKFAPGKVGGKAVNTRMRQQVTFDLKQIQRGGPNGSPPTQDLTEGMRR